MNVEENRRHGSPNVMWKDKLRVYMEEEEEEVVESGWQEDVDLMGDLGIYGGVLLS